MVVELKGDEGQITGADLIVPLKKPKLVALKTECQ